MTKPFLSIIIPYHNSVDTIGPLLDSIKTSVRPPTYEVIVVDDGSDEKLRITNHELKKQLKKYRFPIHIITFLKNKGPAVARNAGVRRARGKFVLFLDGDVRLFPDALANLTKIYTDDPDIVAVTGVWVKEQKTKAFFPNFKALRDWSYWINERDINGYYYLFSTRIASIKRTVFQRLKGFDEKYAGPLVEDIEFTYRIARRYAIIFAPNVRVHHEFEDFGPIARKYFWRTYYWMKLYAKRKRFDPVATKSSEATTALSGVISAGIFLVFVLKSIVEVIQEIYQPGIKIVVDGFAGTQHGWYDLFWKFFGLIGIVCILLHVWFIRKFLFFVFREKGIVFAIKSFFVGLVLYGYIVAGAVWGKIHN